MSEITRAQVFDFLRQYGDKGLLILRTALDIALDPNIDHRLGDFSYKHLVIRLRAMGINYNPSNLLRIMEREYSLIEKTYSSSNQKWWRFIDLDGIRNAVNEYMGGTSFDDPRLRILLIKYRSLEPTRILSFLKRISSKPVISSIDKKVFKEIVFKELDLIAEILENMMEYEDVFEKEIAVLNEIILLADRVAARLEGEKRLSGSDLKTTIEESRLGEPL